MNNEKLNRLCGLLSASKDWVPAVTLAAQLQTTTRTIQNYVNRINAASTSGPLIISSHNGYRLISSGHLISQLKAPVKKVLPDTPDSRIWYAIRKILVEHIDYEVLLETLHISESTMESDMLKIRAIGKKHHLHLKKRGAEMAFYGKQSDIRLLSYRCVLNTLKAGNKQLSQNFMVQSFLEYDYAKITDILSRVLSEFGLRLNAYQYFPLQLLLILQYRDVHRNKILTSSESPIPGIQKYPEFTIASVLADRLSGIQGCVYNIWEKEYLAGLLLSLTESKTPEKSKLIPNYYELRYFTLHNLENAGNALGLDLHNEAFVDSMVNYFQRLIARNRMELYSQDPTFLSLKESHPIVHDVSIWILLFMSAQFHMEIAPVEIGYLTQILCNYIKDKAYPFEMTVDAILVCPSFDEFPESLQAVLNTRLQPAVRITQIIDTLDTENIQDQGCLYLSVLPLKGIRHHVNISFYPRSADFRHIYSEIHRMKMKIYCEKLAGEMEHLLRPELFSNGRELLSSHKILSSICTDLISKGYAEDGLLQDLIRRESIDPSIFHDNVLILHAYGDFIRKDFLSLMFPAAAIPWEGTTVRMICVLGIRPAPARTNYFHTIYDLCIKVFSSTTNLLALEQTRSSEEFLALLRTIDLA